MAALDDLLASLGEVSLRGGGGGERGEGGGDADLGRWMDSKSVPEGFRLRK